MAERTVRINVRRRKGYFFLGSMPTATSSNDSRTRVAKVICREASDVRTSTRINGSQYYSKSHPGRPSRSHNSTHSTFHVRSVAFFSTPVTLVNARNNTGQPQKLLRHFVKLATQNLCRSCRINFTQRGTFTALHTCHLPRPPAIDLFPVADTILQSATDIRVNNLATTVSAKFNIQKVLTP